MRSEMQLLALLAVIASSCAFHRASDVRIMPQHPHDSDKLKWFTPNSLNQHEFFPFMPIKIMKLHELFVLFLRVGDAGHLFLLCAAPTG